MGNYQITTKDDFINFCSQNWNELNRYLDQQQQSIPVPLYASIDIRESREKFAPVDHNIYPAGFNNICITDLTESSHNFRQAILKHSPQAKRIGILPESHTKNLFYLDNLAMLAKAIRDGGFEVVLLSLDSNLFAEQTSIHLISHSKYDLELKYAEIRENKIIITENNQSIDLCILNNDQSQPFDIDWDSVETPILPTPKIGWFKRNKIRHFKLYQDIVEQFCLHYSIDPMLLQAYFHSSDGIDFSTKEGLEQLAAEVDKVITQIGTDKKVFVKAGQGTYGMGIQVVSSGAEILAMNRKKRNKMDVGKNRKKFTSVIIQEGVDTVLKYEDDPAEITIYLVDGESIGGFMRVNGQKDTLSNLNSKGMVFRKFCISEIRQDQDHKAKEATYSIIARLANLAAGLEIKEVLA
jgi:glutamate--cysteine ligase